MNYSHIPYVATAIFVLLMSTLVIYLIRSSFKDREEDDNFEKQLKYNLNPEMEQEEEESYLTKKLKILPEKMIKSGIVEEGTSVPGLQKKLLLMGALLFTGTVLLSRNVFAGIVPIVFAYSGLFIWASFKINKTRNLIDEQIPSFVATFKANIQANQHSQNAMIRAIDNTAYPLYGELAYAKAIMEAGDFKAGIIALRRSTENETLRQMASCIELASSSGSNIESQLEIIEDIIVDKQSIERKKKLGVNENKPLFIIASLFVPVAFFGSYFLSEMHRDYWFTTTGSWIVLIGILITMIFSSFATWKVIQKVDIN